MRTAKTLIRLGRCPGRAESSLGAQVILLVLSCTYSLSKKPSVLFCSCKLYELCHKKTCLQVCDQVRLKPTCSATETSKSLAISGTLQSLYNANRYNTGGKCGTLLQNVSTEFCSNATSGNSRDSSNAKKRVNKGRCQRLL